MNIKPNIVACMLLLALAAACKKDKARALDTASLTIANALPTGDSVLTNWNPYEKISSFNYYSAAAVAPGSFVEFGGYADSISLALAPVSDTLAPVFEQSLHLTAGGIYSLFLTGIPGKPDYLFTQDTVPIIPTADSAFGLRFVHLLAGAGPVNIVLQGILGDSITVASNLSYKSITSFKLMPFSLSVPNYYFNIEDAVTGAVLTADTVVPVPLQNSGQAVVVLQSKSVTVALYQNLVYGPRTFVINNY